MGLNTFQYYTIHNIIFSQKIALTILIDFCVKMKEKLLYGSSTDQFEIELRQQSDVNEDLFTCQNTEFTNNVFIPKLRLYCHENSYTPFRRLQVARK